MIANVRGALFYHVTLSLYYCGGGGQQAHSRNYANAEWKKSDVGRVKAMIFDESRRHAHTLDLCKPNRSLDSPTGGEGDGGEEEVDAGVADDVNDSFEDPAADTSEEVSHPTTPAPPPEEPPCHGWSVQKTHQLTPGTRHIGVLAMWIQNQKNKIKKTLYDFGYASELQAAMMTC